MRTALIASALAALLAGIANPVFAAGSPSPAPAPASSQPVAQVVAEPPPQAPSAPVEMSSEPYMAPDGSMRYVYSGRADPRLVCRPLYVCDVALEAGETILNIAIGDSVRWVIAAAQSGPGGSTPHVFVKPTETDLETNLVITTTKRVYYLRLASAAMASNPRISYSYPEDEAAALAARQADERERQAERAADLPLVPPDQLDSKYRIEGDKALTPSRVYNDGVHTYIEFATLPNDLPIVLAIAPDGSNQVVNFRLKDSMFIIDGVQSGFDLVLNAGTGRHGRGERRCYIRHL
jgi:type IV secretion system protein VirB9